MSKNIERVNDKAELIKATTKDLLADMLLDQYDEVDRLLKRIATWDGHECVAFGWVVITESDLRNYQRDLIDLERMRMMEVDLVEIIKSLSKGEA